MIAFIPIFMVLNRHRMLHVLGSSWPLILLPLLALASLLWSQYPESTARYGFYYLLTVIAGCYIGAGMREQDALKGLFIGLAIVGVLNVLMGRSVVIGTTGEIAFMGIQGSKNAAGEIAGAAVIVSAAMICYGWAKREHVWTVAAIPSITIAGFTLLLSKATGALVATVISMICLSLWILSFRLNRQIRTATFIVVLIIVATMLATLDYWLPPLFDLLLENSGKDAGLTGRDVLWLEADEQIAAKPVLGRGYNAFWVPGNLEAERLWTEMRIASRTGFNFHNTYREILVDLGYVGLVFFAIVAAVSSFVLLSRAIVAPTIPLVMCSALLVYFAIKLPFETFGFGGMHLLSMLLYTCWAMGYSSLQEARQR